MFKIIANRLVGPKIYEIIIKADKLIEQPQPGQFFNLKVNKLKSKDPFLRRPFSVFDFNPVSQQLTFVYRVVGRGTEILSSFKVGDSLDLLGPLGKGFTLPENKKSLHLIGGGIGIAPLYYLARVLADQQQLSIYLGAETKTELNFFQQKFSELKCSIKLTAMAEKLDFKGTALQLWLKNLPANKADFIYVCGPEKMLLAVEKEALARNIDGELSVEKRMGCGIGICLSCSCQSVESPLTRKRACIEGPVFKLGEVELDE
ncbi:dihydroorotate dehydrogenase electron transfer subunit [Halanaerobium salsuginis]|uniref:Dihydroorotate oxidase B, electron transfer subunit n=1 Tax=Halanaerobium salsuginis TaxID=29563 RepID=A0A1I4JNG2_9FIRM|nr:dihydroorotate dehydrogenase electron transfer subunit [Halanaerobium salsuginis]SFL68024.1 dihydroorotate oxidase B, electron transfer subunit [Halanaerobium salsuginis]